jgi:hypothetical protein
VLGHAGGEHRDDAGECDGGETADGPFPRRTAEQTHGALTVGRSIREPALPTVYVPLAEHPDTMAYIVVFLVVRSSGAPPLSVSRSLATALHSVDPNLILTFTPIDEQISQALAQDHR